MGVLLWRRVLDEFNALFNVPFETLGAGLEELLFLLVDTVKDIDGLLGTVGLCVMG